MFIPNHSSFNHSDLFRKNPYIYKSLHLSLLRGGADLYIEDAKKIRGQGRGRKKGARRRPEAPRVATGSPCAGLSPPNPSWEPPEGEKRPYGPLREKWENSPGENRAGNRPTGREILEGPRRRRETPENMAALALRGPQGRLPGPAGPLFSSPWGPQPAQGS